MKTYYEILGVPAAATADEIKRAFRREIARYHPDKVHHLGTEFQEIAAVRAAELTEAYRVLMDESARHQYDWALGEAPPAAAPPPAPSSGSDPPRSRPVQPPEPVNE